MLDSLKKITLTFKSLQYLLIIDEICSGIKPSLAIKILIFSTFRKTKIFSFSKSCQDNFDVSCFKIIDNATSFCQLKIK